MVVSEWGSGLAARGDGQSSPARLPMTLSPAREKSGGMPSRTAGDGRCGVLVFCAGPGNLLVPAVFALLVRQV